ncbi:helix-turn-helix transcriptional regulator [Mitsuokella jalaludinii]|uniref:helix-turn-helix domain-containing protein n=1 Tax=Mitsuokella jalaludinii TaxID=187979 RepID=UPI003079B567
MTLGELIREYRDQHGMSMDEFARLSNLSKGYISMLEKNKNPRNGKPITPSIATYTDVAAAMHVSVAELMEKVGEKNEGLPDLNARDERQIERDLEDMMHSVSTAAYEGDSDAQEDIEAFKATLKSAMIQAKRIAKKKYTPRKYQQ